jgi:hypothetical protein
LNEINENLITILKNKFKINIEEASFANGYIPKYIILDRTRNIHSYVTFIKVSNDCINGDFFSQSKDYITSFIELIKIQYSQLDRPLFFIYENELGDIEVVESNLIRLHILENGTKDIISYIFNNSIKGQTLFKQIKSEL